MTGSNAVGRSGKRLYDGVLNMPRLADWLSFEILSPGECVELLAELRGTAGDAAAVYGLAPEGKVHSLARRTTRLCPRPAIRDSVFTTFKELRGRLSEAFEVPIASCEEPQFLRYQEGDYFVAHQDGNTPSIRDDSRHRRVSLIVFLNDPVDYSGGDLLFHTGPAERVPAPAARGTALAFRSELTHEVTPLTAGERYTIVTWYR